MRVSVVQMSPGADKAANIAQAGRLLEAAIADDRPAIAALPEMWTCLGGDRETKFRGPKPVGRFDSGRRRGYDDREEFRARDVNEREPDMPLGGEE